MFLNNNNIKTSLDIYHRFGNSSSPTVLIVLDQMRHIGKGRDDVVATSFGPGLMIEMFRMRRCREIKTEQVVLSGGITTKYRFWFSQILKSLTINRWWRVVNTNR